MMLAGIRVPDAQVLELARLLREAELPATAETLEKAYDAERAIVALTIADRESILRALEDCPEEPRRTPRSLAQRARVARARGVV